MYRKITKSGLSDSDQVLPTTMGGTGSSNPATALNNLYLASQSDLGVSVANLGTDGLLIKGKLPSSVSSLSSVMVDTLQGPTSVAKSQSIQLKITDYDVFKKYKLQAISGTVARSGDTITYTASGKVGQSGFYMNGKTVKIQVTGDVPAKPVVTSPVNNSTGMPFSVTVSVAAFSMASGNDTHASTDWIISKDPNFTDIVKPIIQDTVNKTSLTMNDLDLSTDYYVKCRFRGATTGVGCWSDAVHFKTMAGYVNAPAITFPINNSNGNSLAITITSTAFSSMPNTDSHVSTDWQIATDANFTNIYVNDAGDNVNKTSLSVNILAPTSQYYLRCRHNGANFGKSAWSSTVIFSTTSQASLSSTFTTPGTYSLTVPGGVSTMTVTGTGGGGAGGSIVDSGNSMDFGASGGGSSGVMVQNYNIAVIAGHVLSIIVGAGAVAGGGNGAATIIKDATTNTVLLTLAGGIQGYLSQGGNSWTLPGGSIATTAPFFAYNGSPGVDTTTSVDNGDGTFTSIPSGIGGAGGKGLFNTPGGVGMTSVSTHSTYGYAPVVPSTSYGAGGGGGASTDANSGGAAWGAAGVGGYMAIKFNQTLAYNIPGSYTEVIPSGVTSIAIQADAPGGGGAYCGDGSYDSCASGGGGAGYSGTLAVAAGYTLTMQVGSGGTGNLSVSGGTIDGGTGTSTTITIKNASGTIVGQLTLNGGTGGSTDAYTPSAGVGGTLTRSGLFATGTATPGANGATSNKSTGTPVGGGNPGVIIGANYGHGGGAAPSNAGMYGANGQAGYISISM